MVFRSPIGALLWYSRHHDGLRSAHPDPSCTLRVHGRVDPAERHLAAIVIERALADLRESERRLLIGYHIGGVTVVQLAGERGRSPSATYGALSRALGRFAARLRAAGLLVDPDAEGAQV